MDTSSVRLCCINPALQRPGLPVALNKAAAQTLGGWEAGGQDLCNKAGPAGAAGSAANTNSMLRWQHCLPSLVNRPF